MFLCLEVIRIEERILIGSPVSVHISAIRLAEINSASMTMRRQGIKGFIVGDGHLDDEISFALAILSLVHVCTNGGSR